MMHLVPDKSGEGKKHDKTNNNVKTKNLHI
jgi:hypothetical protein